MLDNYAYLISADTVYTTEPYTTTAANTNQPNILIMTVFLRKIGKHVIKLKDKYFSVSKALS